MAENELAQFQERLLNHLLAQIEDDGIFASLSIEGLDQDRANYLAIFAPRMVAVAATLVKR